MKNTCCVPFCESRRNSVKLHRFPKTEIGLKWLTSIHCARLKELSLGELHNYFVCHKHFEKRFVTGSSRLVMKAYPTLFTHEEIKTGISAHTQDDYGNQNFLSEHDYTQSRKRKHEDHTYFKIHDIGEIQRAQDYNIPSTSKLCKPLDHNQEIELQDRNDKMESSTSKITDDKAIQQFQTPECTNVVTPKKTMKRFVIPKNKLTARCHSILKKYKKAKKQLNFATRIKKAVKFSKKENFDKITSNLNPVAKKILWMQITQCTKQIKGRRFTDEEKVIALAIMKQSPKSYKFLRRIFILPSIRSINKMTSNCNWKLESIPKYLM